MEWTCVTQFDVGRRAGLTWAPSAWAELQIEITQGVDTALRCRRALGGRAPEPHAPGCRRHRRGGPGPSGRFAPLDRKDMLQKPTTVRRCSSMTGAGRAARCWSLAGSAARPDQYEIQFQVFDVLRGEHCWATASPHSRRFRRSAHRVADLIYEKLTRCARRVLDRIAYVTVVRSPGRTNFDSSYRLVIADADGENPGSWWSLRNPSCHSLVPRWPEDRLRIV